jgi:YD repeat-containing protein
MINKIKKICCWFIVVIPSFIVVNAQNNELEATKIVTHSPNAGSLGKYGDYPVDMSTGVPQIEIPLYTIKSGSLELPISISYHGGGTKIDEESSFVGLGWALNAGGVITKVIKDRDDYSSDLGFIARHNQIPDYNSIDAGVIGGVGNSSELLAEYNNYDKEPDLYIVNANNVSSKFCMDNDGNYISLNYEPYKYTVDYPNELITILDKFGNTYRFGHGLDGTTAYETTSENYVGYQTNTTVTNGATTAWYLTEIISADKADTIKFTYETLPYTLHAPGNVDRWTYEATPTNGVYDKRGVLHQGINYGERDVSIPNARVIDKIIFKNGSVQFSLVDDRQDIDAENLHQNVRIAGFSVFDNHNSLIKKIVFDNNHYFDRTASGNSIGNGTIYSFEKKSLQINGVQFYNSQNEFVNDYKFDYNSTSLPPRNTTSQDLWGYYNGKPSTDFIPQNFYTDNSPGLNHPIFIGSDRSPDPNYVKAASLEKITYPTGGYTSYEFEPNYYLTDDQKAGKTQKIKQLSSFALNRLSSCAPTYYNGAGPSTIYEFTVNEDLGTSTDQVIASLSFHFSDYINYNGMPMVAKFYRLGDEANGVTYQQTASESSNSKTINTTFVLYKNQTYRIELYTNGVTGSTQSMCNSPFIEVYVNYNYWDFASPQYITPLQAGGLRAKSISNYDGNGTLLMKKTYEYGSETYGSSSIGAGNLISDPNNNFYFYPELYASDQCDADLENCLHFSSNSQIPLGFNHGSPVDYDKVTEKTVSTQTGTANGKTEYYYSRTGSIHEPMDSYEHPYNYFYYPEWESSVLLKKIDYALKQDGTYEPVTSIENTFSQASEKRIKTLKVMEYQPDTWAWFYCGQPPGSSSYGYGDNPNRFFFYNFYVSVGRNRKEKEITTSYVDGIPALTTESDYQYNNNQEINKITSLDSKNQSIETELKYTGDLDYTTLKNNNMISYPVLREQTLNGNVIQGELLKYNDDGQQTDFYKFNSAAPIPPVDYVTKDAVPNYYEEKQTFGYFPSTKRMEEARIQNSITTVYLWGYNSEYPVAKVVGSDYITVSSVISQSQIDAAIGNGGDATLRSLLNSLRTDSRTKNALTTTYTYSPLVGMTSETDPSGKTIYYQYDPFGRLNTIKDQDDHILKKICYNYTGQQGQCSLYASDAVSGDYYSQNCSSGQSAVAYHVSVPQGMFTSSVDQATANQLAQQYAQSQANQYGACEIPNVSLYGDDEVGTDFSIVLHNVGTGQDYSFNVYAHNAVTLSDVLPQGTYDISLTPNSSLGYYNYSVGCGYYDAGPGGSTITFYGVDISSTCNSITID